MSKFSLNPEFQKLWLIFCKNGVELAQVWWVGPRYDCMSVCACVRACVCVCEGNKYKMSRSPIIWLVQQEHCMNNPNLKVLTQLLNKYTVLRH